jgi:hypothetical protein
MESFIKNIKITQLNCGTTSCEFATTGVVTTTSNPVDMTGFGGVCVVAGITKAEYDDTTGSAVKLYLSYSCSSGGTFHAIAGTAVESGTSGTNFYLASELVKPLPEQHWIAGTVVFSGTSSWVGDVIAYQYNAHNYPITQGTCNFTDINISATSGTA